MESSTMIDTYIRHSPSKCNLYAAQPAMFVLENVLGHKQPVGIPAHRGVAVEDGVNAGLKDMAAYDRDCVDVALTKYDSLTAMSGDPRREKYRDTIPDMVTTALDELRRYGKPTEMQGFVTWEPPELKLPIVGYFDYAWSHIGILADLKTTERMPSEIKRGHARQVALYATSNNIDARLIYVTPKKLEAYHLENIAEHRASLLKIAATIERFLALSDDPEFFVSITTPDVESFYWADPAARQLAYRHWGV
jgi:hypothetical protein